MSLIRESVKLFLIEKRKANPEKWKGWYIITKDEGGIPTEELSVMPFGDQYHALYMTGEKPMSFTFTDEELQLAG